MNDRTELEKAWTKIISQAINQQRIKLNISQEELARRVNCDDKHLGRNERGEKTPGSTLLALIQIELQIDATYLLNIFKEKVKSHNRKQIDER